MPGDDTDVRSIHVRLSALFRKVVSVASKPSVVAGVALLFCLAGTAVLAFAFHRVSPMQDWLVWTMALLAGWVLLFNLSALSFGRFVMVRVLMLDQLPVLESAVLSMAIGTVSFVFAMYVAGALALYNRVFDVALPLVFLLLGARDGTRLLVRLWRDLELRHGGLLSTLIAGFGILCVGMLYLGVLSPDSINYDSSWYHLRVAQDYARWGRIQAFTDYNAIVPHLASMLHTWGYLVPGLSGASRWMMALHMEFALFLWTLVGVAAGIQRLTGDFSLRSSWVAFFLFPIIFVYDSNIGGAADHVLAFYSVAVLLATLQLQQGVSKGRCALLAIALAGAALTKYQAIYLGLPVAPIVAGFWLRDWMRVRAGGHHSDSVPTRRDLGWAPVILIGLCTLLIAPHFLKNYVFYKNPVYPFLQQIFTHSTPTVPNTTILVNNIFTDVGFVPTGTFFTKVWHALGLFCTFSFAPHYSFTKDVPAFGSLFTLLLPCLLLVPGRRRIGVAAFIASGALMAWGMTYNVDRNLQTFMPILVCVTGALVVQLWRMGWLARVGLVPLMALQLVWGADAPFYGSQDRIDGAMSLIRSTFDGRAKTRFDGYRNSFVAIGKALPKNAKLLLHGSHLSLGIDRDVLQDMAGFQGLIRYDKVRSPRELFDYFQSLGITHFVRTQGLWESSRQEQILYDLFQSRYAVSLGDFGGNRLTAMPTEPPSVEHPYQVLCLGLEGYADGLYPIEALSVNEHLAMSFRHYPTSAQAVQGSNVSEALASADVALVRSSAVDGDVSSILASAFESIPTRGDVAIYARKR